MRAVMLSVINSPLINRLHVHCPVLTGLDQFRPIWMRHSQSFESTSDQIK